MVTLDLLRVNRKAQDPLESVLFVPFWSHFKPHTKAQLERPNRPAQLDNQLVIKGEAYIILFFKRDIIVKWCVCVSEAIQLFSPGN